MKKAKCIKCGEEIKFLQLMMHSCRKHVSCLSCGTKMSFDKKSWVKASMPTLLITFSILAIMFTDRIIEKELAAYFLVPGISLLLVALIWLGIKVRSIKLVLSEHEKHKALQPTANASAELNR